MAVFDGDAVSATRTGRRRLRHDALVGTRLCAAEVAILDVGPAGAFRSVALALQTVLLAALVVAVSADAEVAYGALAVAGCAGDC